MAQDHRECYRKSLHPQEHDGENERSRHGRRTPGWHRAKPGMSAELRLNLPAANQQIVENVSFATGKDGQVQPGLHQIFEVTVKSRLNVIGGVSEHPAAL